MIQMKAINQQTLPRMGERGQGFDVFKLLIAAVVAGAILLILMQTLQVLPQLGNRDPNDIAAETVKTQITNIGLPKFVPNVTFKKDDALSARTIAEKTKALAPDQVCVTTSDSTPGGASSFDDSGDGKTVFYKGGFNQQARLMILCDRQSEIDATISSFPNLGGLGVSSSHCTITEDSSSRYCIISIVSDQ